MSVKLLFILLACLSCSTSPATSSVIHVADAAEKPIGEDVASVLEKKKEIVQSLIEGDSPCMDDIMNGVVTIKKNILTKILSIGKSIITGAIDIGASIISYKLGHLPSTTTTTTTTTAKPCHECPTPKPPCKPKSSVSLQDHGPNTYDNIFYTNDESNQFQQKVRYIPYIECDEDENIAI